MMGGNKKNNFMGGHSWWEKGTEVSNIFATVKPVLNGHTRAIKWWYSETCANGHLYSETTCIKRPLCDVPKVSA